MVEWITVILSNTIMVGNLMNNTGPRSHVGIIMIVGIYQQERMRVNDYLYPRLEIRNFIEAYTTEPLIPGIN